MRTPALALLAVALLTMPAVAKPVAAAKPQIQDPSGDQRGLGAGYDVRSALFSTTGVMVHSGKRATYVPTRLVVTVTYGGPVAHDFYSAQVVAFATSTCQVYLEMYGIERRTYGAGSCVENAFAVPTTVHGNVLTLTLPFSYLGKSNLRPGVVLSQLETWTNVADPSSGYESGDLLGSAFAVDVGSSDVTYTIR